ncbi:MAG: alpha/beta hydrolase [Candidatus Promineifilaceae bacterium]|nr:alpha/beta hydrolase [Candidatus Promineifilaceae bacterium]
MPRRLLIAPRWAGTAGDDWYPWLLRQELPYEAIDVVPAPAPGAPEIGPWVAALHAAVAESAIPSEETLLVGHSVGCRALLHMLSGHPSTESLAQPWPTFAGMLCVAGWWTVDKPWAGLRPWIRRPINLPRVRATAAPIHVLISDNDPFTADWEATVAQWRELLDAEVTVHEGAAHFNKTEQPEVVAALRVM